MKSPLLTKELAALSSVYLSRCVDEGKKLKPEPSKPWNWMVFFTFRAEVLFTDAQFELGVFFNSSNSSWSFSYSSWSFFPYAQFELKFFL